ncbi:hypothetical protein PGT21_005124 [Puccinia graminis f. sp. tritici]|uniref:Uncharacterized protein n=2 Tax=Puccinia graminis f. sp. tritici TaxID=56615 RepID=A0A5B0NB53_PUCGR|nr:hypothetical protein PGT21_005124 [Puccinia graminis f. sp. tritici]KAA1129927.1 hypothetical protein PGTUg99_004376 [Puccinia graminis f. sp. tritici]
MGASLVARVEGIGVDAFQLVTDRLLRDHQALPRERWLAVIRSFRQPLPPIEHATKPPDRQDDALDDRNKGKKQRTMYCLRHSGKPGQLVALIEDAEAPIRCHQDTTSQEPDLSAPFDTNEFHKKTEDGPSASQNHEKHTGDVNTANSQPTPVDQPSTNDNGTETATPRIAVTNDQESTDMVLDGAIKTPSVKIAPSHYRVSIVSVPDSFEQLLSSTICAPQTSLIPSAWCPRPNIVAIEGMSWGIYSSSFESEISPTSNMGSMASSMWTKDTQPDWWIRLGTVTNKGATSGNTSLSWLILELECAASPIELDPSFELLESVMHALLRPDGKLLVKPFRPTAKSLMEAGLTSEESNLTTSSPHPPKTATLRNGYCMLMLAKQESLI